MDLISEKQLNKKRNMSDEEIKQLRRDIQRQYVIYPRSYVWNKLFERIYRQYKESLSKRELAERILGLSEEEFNKLKSGEFVKVFNKINMDNMKFTKEVMDIVKECLITHGNIPEFVAIELQIPIDRAEEYIESTFTLTGMTMKDFGKELVRRMYRENKTIAEIYDAVWLEMADIESVIKAEEGQNTSSKKPSEVVNVELLQSNNTSSKTKESKKAATKVSKRRDTKTFKKLEEMTVRVLDNYYYNPRNVAIVERYMNEMKNEYGITDFPEEKVDFFGECIEFAQSGFKNIEFFVRVCISFRKYQEAIEFISNNIHNERISGEEKRKLNELKKHLEYSKKKEYLAEKIVSGYTDVKELANLTGLLEVDVIHMKNSILNMKNGKRAISFDDEGEK